MSYALKTVCQRKAAAAIDFGSYERTAGENERKTLICRLKLLNK
jgi:hypothetical protein